MKESISPDNNPILVAGRRDKVDATWWVQATPGTTYWRCLVPARHLPGQALQMGIQAVKEDRKGVPYMAQGKGDVYIWQFLGDEVRSRIAHGIRHFRDIRTLMEVDDNYLRPVPKHLQRTSPWRPTVAEAMELRRKGKGTGYSNQSHRRDAEWVDGIICSTPYLADRYAEYNENVWVCPNSIDVRDWDIYDRDPHDTLRIVYYASGSHMNVDTPLVTRALKWASKQPDVEIYTVGAVNAAWSFPHQKIGWMNDLREARKQLFRFDLGIAPLKGNDWANGKSDVKALEYAMAGVLPLVSDAVPYQPLKEAIPDLMVGDAEWEEAIRYYVENREYIAPRAAEFKAWVLENRTIEKTIHTWREAVRG